MTAMEKQVNKNLLKHHCATRIQCPQCRTILDCPQAVSIDLIGATGDLVHTWILCAKCYDGAKEKILGMQLGDNRKLEIHDGRELFPTRTKGRKTARCRAFKQCQNPATTTLSHPVLGEVPCCDRCKTRLENAQ